MKFLQDIHYQGAETHKAVPYTQVRSAKGGVEGRPERQSCCCGAASGRGARGTQPARSAWVPDIQQAVRASAGHWCAQSKSLDDSAASPVLQSPGTIMSAPLKQSHAECSGPCILLMQVTRKSRVHIISHDLHAGGATASELPSNAVLRVQVQDPRIAKHSKPLAGVTGSSPSSSPQLSDYREACLSSLHVRLAGGRSAVWLRMVIMYSDGTMCYCWVHEYVQYVWLPQVGHGH